MGIILHYGKVLLIICCFTITSYVSVYSIQTELEKNNVVTVISNNSENPVIDGRLEIEEWNASEPKTVLLYGRENRDYTIEVEIRSIYNEKTGNITMGIEIPHKEIGPLNYFVMVFHTNKSAPLLSKIDNVLTFGKKNDVKEIYFNTNASYDGHTGGHEIVKWSDVENDSFGRCLDVGNSITAEICFPLNSGDYRGGDIMLRKGQEIDFFIFYMNTKYSNESMAYYQYDKISMEYDVCTLKIAGKTNYTPFYVLITGTFVVLGIGVLSYIYSKDE